MPTTVLTASTAMLPETSPDAHANTLAASSPALISGVAAVGVPTLIFGVAAVLLSLAFYLLVVATRTTAEQDEAEGQSPQLRHARATSPAQLLEESDPPFSERVWNPLRDRAATIGRRVTGADASQRYAEKLAKAGSPANWTVDRFIGTKVIGAVAAFVASTLVLVAVRVPFPVLLTLVAGASAAGFFAANMWIYQITYDRNQRVERDLADAIDLLTISVEAGLGFNAAMQQVARNVPGPVGEEFSRALREMQLGSGRKEALRSLAARTDVPDLKSFVTSMVQAETFGIPVAQVLRVQTSEMRIKRRQRAEEKAQKVPVKITIPLIFCILPCLFVVVLGPAGLSILDSFF